MNILIADKFSAKAIEELRGMGNSLTYNPELSDDALAEAIGATAADVLVVRSTKVSGKMLRGADNLQLVVRAGAGVNTIDIETASKLGIFVANCPGKNAAAVAELVMGLILALDRRIPENTEAFQTGLWRKKEFSKAAGLKGRTLGLVGFGNIAKEVAKRARAFDLKICAWSRSLTAEAAEEYGVARLDSPISVAAAADVVSVHVAAAKETNGLCGKDFFNAMKPGALFINTSRGDVLDESSLQEAVKNKGIKAGLDVFANEPSAGEAPWRSALAGLPGVCATHHIGASTTQAEDAIGAEALRVIKTFCASGEVLNCVNIDLNSPATHILTVRHLNRVGALAAILEPIRQANINVLEMENLIFSGEEAAVAKIRLSQEPTSAVLSKIKETNPAILSLSIARLGA